MKRLVALVSTKNKTPEAVAGEVMRAVEKHRQHERTEDGTFVCELTEDASGVRRSMIATSIIAVVAFLAIATGFFYWFSLRPTHIRARCAYQADSRGLHDRVEFEYLMCLRRAGLTK